MRLTQGRERMLPMLFRDLLGEDFPTLLWDREKGYRWAPAVDAYEKDGELHLEAELPGISRDNIQVQFSDGVLSISGERRLTEEKMHGSYFSRERFEGAFCRSFRIGDAYDPNSINARFQDGVLHVQVSKKETSKPVNIKVD